MDLDAKVIAELDGTLVLEANQEDGTRVRFRMDASDAFAVAEALCEVARSLGAASNFRRMPSDDDARAD
jgi:hypothetical protein